MGTNLKDPLKNTLILFALFSFFIGFSQSKSFVVKYINTPIVLDGNLNESVWKDAQSATNFWQYFPVDSVQAQQQAEIKMLFDDNNLYVGIKVNAPDNDFIVPSLRRDFRAGGSDNIS